MAATSCLDTEEQIAESEFIWWLHKLMATEAQYKYFEKLYEEESDRSKTLADHARSNLTILALYVAVISFATQRHLEHPFSAAFLLIGIPSILISFVVSLWATNVSDFEVASLPMELIEEYGDKPMKDAHFYDNRIEDFVVAIEKNSPINDKKANLLYWARIALVLGLIAHSFAVMLVILGE